MNSFAQQVYDCISKIPKGKVMTYAQVAAALGKPGASRAVGNALNKNPKIGIIPCHRIVRSNGEIGGFALGSKKKIAMLTQEGVVVENNRVDLSTYAV